ncbi:hypothetical protein C8R45DRAFT_1012429 [Mycena sanguinolenta]|nr:hypothetical protein C8R45DRAFT_1012429 [Mycena sanguinolenta]
MAIWKRLIFEKRILFAGVLLLSPVLVGFLWHLSPGILRRLQKPLWPRKKYSTYRSALEEDQYWAAAELYGRRLRSSDARLRGRGASEVRIPVVTSYVPALLPWYRQRRRKKSPDYYLSLRTLCKWHRMVFPGPWHPNIAQAVKMRASFSGDDKREIHRISRMLPDGLVFGKTAKWKPKYRNIWRKWLRKEREVNVVFQY